MCSRYPLVFATMLAALSTLLTSTTATAAPSAELWEDWQTQSDTPATKPSVTHTAWQAWLDEYLVTQDNGATTAVRYQAVDEAGRLALDNYIQTLAATDPLTLSRAEQFAYWVNLYNAITVQVVLNNPSKDSITSMGSGWFTRGPWDEAFIRINNKPVTLNDIEHRILRPIWQDHRIHYVVNCASIGCPNLSPKALTATNHLDQLDEAERNFINHPKGVTINAQGKLVLSKIYQWYREDFPSDDDAFVAYLAQAMDDRAQLKLSTSQLREKFEDVRYAYDWDLNSAP